MSFQSWWLNDPKYKDWVTRGTASNTAICKVCRIKKPITLSATMVTTALDSHAKSKKHTESMDQIKMNNQKMDNFFGKLSSTSEEKMPSSSSSKDNMSSSSSSKDKKMSASFSSKEIMMNTFNSEQRNQAELMWILFCIQHNIPDRASDNVVELFRNMFPASFANNSAISRMTLGRSKISYTTNFGIAPYIKNILLTDVSKARWVTVSYDESLNHNLQRGQMDFLIRYWDDNSSQIVTRYFNSYFLGHAKVEDLKESFKASLEGILEERICQVSMDGPHVNLRLLKEFKADRQEKELPEIIDIGSCNLHTTHNAFKGKFILLLYS